MVFQPCVGMASRRDSTSASVSHSYTSIEEPALVSVVVPAHNAEPFIGELLSSVLAQSYRHIEVLVLDDGSTDATSHVVAQHACDARLKHSRSETNIGVNKATSRLLNEVRGDYWAYPGADDILDDDFLACRVALMQRHPSAVISHGTAHYIDSGGHELAVSYPSLDLPLLMSGEKALRVLLQHNIINTPSVLIRNDATKKIAQHFETDWRYAQDWFLWFLLVSTGGDVVYDATPRHSYRIHGDSLTNDPAKGANKRIETRLVPLCALSACASYSHPALKLWERWRGALYDLYLSRVCRMLASGLRSAETLRRAASAYAGRPVHRPSLRHELLARSPFLWRSLVSERIAKRRQAFPVSGLAAIDDPLFR
jgi:glycosyltransferase involved in cell wall biosynthesis